MVTLKADVLAVAPVEAIRTPLHVAADWPGYFLNGPAVVHSSSGLAPTLLTPSTDGRSEGSKPSHGRQCAPQIDHLFWPQRSLARRQRAPRGRLAFTLGIRRSDKLQVRRMSMVWMALPP